MMKKLFKREPELNKEVRTMPEDLRVDLPGEFKQKLMDLGILKNSN